MVFDRRAIVKGPVYDSRTCLRYCATSNRCPEFLSKCLWLESASPKNPSRIRFVLFEAELGDGDISQITHAITNALRAPTHAMPKRISTTTSVINSSDPIEPEVVEDSGDEADAVDVVAATPKAPRQQRKTIKTPDASQSIDRGCISAAFAAGKDISSQHKKYLICAAWLKEHRSIDAVSAKSHLHLLSLNRVAYQYT